MSPYLGEFKCWNDVYLHYKDIHNMELPEKEPYVLVAFKNISSDLRPSKPNNKFVLYIQDDKLVCVNYIHYIGPDNHSENLRYLRPECYIYFNGLFELIQSRYEEYLNPKLIVKEYSEIEI